MMGDSVSKTVRISSEAMAKVEKLRSKIFLDSGRKLSKRVLMDLLVDLAYDEALRILAGGGEGLVVRDEEDVRRILKEG